MTRRFQRTIEDFTCDQCGTSVQGDGYTNHCPHCLWSKHVDVNPGDRAEPCQGPMEPIAAKQKHGEWRVIHRCTTCGIERPCTVRPSDNRSALAGLLKTPGR